MKKILGTLLVPFALFAFEVSFNKKFEKEVTPDKLSTGITVVVKKDNEVGISPQLEKFNKFISKNENIEKRAGSFAIRAEYKYDKGHSTLIGYTGNLRYTIYSTESKDMNRFIKTLLKLKKHDDTSISISRLKWIVSQEKQTQAIEALRLESIIWAQEYAQKLSIETNKTCEVDKININSQTYRPFYQSARSEVMMMDSKIKSNIPVPKATKNIVSIKPNYVLECK